jgi:hypothetical protein
MKTETQPSPEVKPAITEADVVAFLVTINCEVRERTAKLCENLGFDPTKVEVGPGSRPFCISAWKGPNYAYGYGKTLAEAEENFAAEMRQKAPAPEKLRAEAAALVAQAEKLEATTAGKETA